ncbi:TetR/AcrR family transcriptional regulator C-terminal domain-containing protein [Pseudonocardia ailaonensis]|uniref:TetR/AcrR family transcriptional regulator C-terminal domain-containing protein n=1 Tax=Pseudonocardia ailaonensis TaxID=367279 RepID=A0ABN2N2L9_9PSEU
MSLSRAQVVDAAYAVLGEQGLAGTSMRRVATELGVQPGALYYHVPSKQDLLTEVAVRILAAGPVSGVDPRQAAHDLRAALLRVRDGAEVVSFVRAFRPEALEPLHALPGLFGGLPPGRAQWAARTLVHYVLGFVAEEQNRDELVRSTIVADEPMRATESEEAFRFGVDAIVEGLTVLGA